MKVTNNKIGNQPSKIESGKAGRSDAAHGARKDLKTSSGPGVHGSDAKVDVSERGQMMQKAKDIASDTSVDEGKVARLQKMIDEGSYKVDSDKIADRLLDEHMLIPD
jgi:negative regulator of flagellin synthesis FlgM